MEENNKTSTSNNKPGLGWVSLGAGLAGLSVLLGAFGAHSLKAQLTEKKLCDALNGNLPPDCQVLAVEKTTSDFEARFQAVKRWYRYQCYSGDSLLYRNQAWMVKDLDIGSGIPPDELMVLAGEEGIPNPRLQMNKMIRRGILYVHLGRIHVT